MTELTASTYLFIGMIVASLVAVFIVLERMRRAELRHRRERHYEVQEFPARRHGAFQDRPAPSGWVPRSGPAQRDRQHGRALEVDAAVLHEAYLDEGYGREDNGTRDQDSSTDRTAFRSVEADSGSRYTASPSLSRDSSDSYSKSGSYDSGGSSDSCGGGGGGE